MIVRYANLNPVALGLKVVLTVQWARGASEAPHIEFLVKSPLFVLVSEILLMSSGAEPAFVNVIVLGHFPFPPSGYQMEFGSDKAPPPDC